MLNSQFWKYQNLEFDHDFGNAKIVNSRFWIAKMLNSRFWKYQNLEFDHEFANAKIVNSRFWTASFRQVNAINLMKRQLKKNQMMWYLY